MNYENREPNYLDYFSGGVPAGVIFMLDIEKLRNIADTLEEKEGHLSTITEVCFIGLVAYFEAFCKNHFASLLNICPELIMNEGWPLLA